MYILKIHGAVSNLDVSSMKEKIAVVSDKGVLSVFDLFTEEKLEEFLDVNGVAFNAVLEDMMCFSGADYLAIKVAKFPEFKQKFSGVVLGFNGSLVYSLQGSTVTTIKVLYDKTNWECLFKNIAFNLI